MDPNYFVFFFPHADDWVPY